MRKKKNETLAEKTLKRNSKLLKFWKDFDTLESFQLRHIVQNVPEEKF